MYNYISEAMAKKPESELDEELWNSPNHPLLEQLPLPPQALQGMWQTRGDGARRRAEQKPADPMKVLMFYDFCREHKGAAA